MIASRARTVSVKAQAKQQVRRTAARSFLGGLPVEILPRARGGTGRGPEMVVLRPERPLIGRRLACRQRCGLVLHPGTAQATEGYGPSRTRPRSCPARARKPLPSTAWDSPKLPSRKENHSPQQTGRAGSGKARRSEGPPPHRCSPSASAGQARQGQPGPRRRCRGDLRGECVSETRLRNADGGALLAGNSAGAGAL